MRDSRETKGRVGGRIVRIRQSEQARIGVDGQTQAAFQEALDEKVVVVGLSGAEAQVDSARRDSPEVEPPVLR